MHWRARDDELLEDISDAVPILVAEDVRYITNAFGIRKGHV
jgi:hypothetical protein